jgi:hypothetical protein
LADDAVVGQAVSVPGSLISREKTGNSKRIPESAPFSDENTGIRIMSPVLLGHGEPTRLMPELQPAETLWALVHEPIVNKHIETIEELDAVVGARCAALADEHSIIKNQAGFRWWPKIAKPN